MTCVSLPLTAQSFSKSFLYFQARSYTWLGEEELTFSDWRDGQPNQMYGCGHMTIEGQWTVAACNTKLNAAICEINTGKKVLKYASEYFSYITSALYLH